MDKILHKVSQKVQEVAHSQSVTPSQDNSVSSSDSSKGHLRQGLPDFVFQAVDKYVDSLAPHISPIITKEIDNFQTQTIESLEAHLKEAFHAVFKGDFSAFHHVRDVDQLVVKNQSQAVSSPTPPSGYGQRGLPFAPSDPGLGLNSSGTQDRTLSGTQAFMSVLAAGLDKSSRGDDNETAQKERNVFQEALGKVSEFAKTQSNAGEGELQVFMGKMATEIDKVKTDPDEMVKKIVPEMKIKVGDLLTTHHASLAEKMTAAALTQLKKWLRGHTSTKELGDGAKGDISDAISGLFSKISVSSPHPSTPQNASREIGGPPSTVQPTTAENNTGSSSPQPHGVAGILSKKLSKGLTNVRSSTRDDFRSMLSAIEKTLFNELPESIRGPLAKIFGGDPFDPSVPSSANAGADKDRGLDIFHELGDKFKAIVERVQQGLRDRVLEVVGGGHRRLESLAWMQVQETVVLRVRKYVPDIKVDVEEEDKAAARGP